MKIGFDAKWFNSGHPSGRTFTRQMVERLIRGFPQHTFVFFLKRGDRHLSFPFAAPNAHIEYASFGCNLLSNLVIVPWVAWKHGLDILVTQNFSSPLTGTPQATVVFDAIFKSHPQYFTIRERLYFSFIKPLLYFADGVVTISEFSRCELRRHGCLSGDRPCYVLPLGVDSRFAGTVPPDASEHARLSDRYRLPDRFVLYVGRLNERKNIPNLIRSLQFIDDPQVHLVLAGRQDWKMREIESLVARENLEGRVIRIGPVDDNDLPWLYRQASVFAYVSAIEGFGLPPLEAMASGVPVVTSNLSALSEICGDAALCVDPSRPDRIGAALNSILTNAMLARNLKESGVRLAANYSWEKTASRFIDLISTVVEEWRKCK
jgi:glycosyltransferase involved in cell wall biosynthesis